MLLAFVRGIHRWPVNSPHKGRITRKMFPLDQAIVRFRSRDAYIRQWTESSSVQTMACRLFDTKQIIQINAVLLLVGALESKWDSFDTTLFSVSVCYIYHPNRVCMTSKSKAVICIYIYILEKLFFVSIGTVQYMMCANSRAHCDFNVVFVCLHITRWHYYDHVDLS